MGCERVAERTLAMFRSSDVTGNATRTPVRQLMDIHSSLIGHWGQGVIYPVGTWWVYGGF
jgi:hypothetical protein